ncbi:KAE1 threonylcarbamoyltransferase, partial [Vireo altiloquus]|nr:KAE1 threonylcarbamoyltransferase [Vireo altiloquus]
QVISYSRHRYRILGETLDVAVGNCIDRLARLLQVRPRPDRPRPQCQTTPTLTTPLSPQIPNAPSPGYNVEQLAKSGVAAEMPQNPKGDPKIPKGVPKSQEGTPKRFGGDPKTFFLCPSQAVTPKLLESGEATQEDLCFSLQETAFAMLAEVTERALALTRARHLLLVGGVAC